MRETSSHHLEQYNAPQQEPKHTVSEEIAHIESRKTSEKEQKVASELQTFTIEYDHSLSQEQNEQRLLVLQALKAQEAIKVIDNHLVWDPNPETFDIGRIRLGRTWVYRNQLFEGLDGIKAYTADNLNSEAYKTGKLEPRPLVAFAHSGSELYGSLAQTNKDAILKIEELVPPNSQLNREPLVLKDGTVLPLARLRTIIDLAKFHAQYNPDISDPENIIRRNTLNKLNRVGILTEQDGLMVVDSEALRSRASGQVTGHDITQFNIANALRDIPAYTREQIESDNFDPQVHTPRPILKLPKSIKELSTSKSESKVQPIVEPWEIGGATQWAQYYKLDSGEVITTAELAIATKLQELHARRDPHTKQLYITDPETGEEKKFTNELFSKFSGIRPAFRNEDGKKVSFEDGPVNFFKNYLPHLRELKMFLPDDFKRVSGTESAEVFNIRPQTISSTGYVSFSNADGQFARYYLGKTELIGTKIPREEIAVYRLTADSAGIFRNVHGKKKLLYTLDFASGDMMDAKLQEIKQKKGELTPTQLSANTVFGAKEVSLLLKPYTATNAIPKRADESETAYAQRVAEFNDPEFVITRCKELFEEAHIGIHNLDWNEQLILARAIMEIPNRQRLISFAQKFGLRGLRTLTTADYNVQYAKQLLDFAEDNAEYAHQLFEQYDHLAQTARHIEQLIDPERDLTIIPEQVRRRLPFELRETILRRGKDLLMVNKQIRNSSEVITPSDHVRTFEGLNMLMSMTVELLSHASRFQYELKHTAPNGVVILSVRDSASDKLYNLKLFVRSEASEQGQARINIELDFNTARPHEQLRDLFKQSTTFKRNNKTREQSVLRVGLDLEDKTEQPTLSLDIGRNPLDDDEIKRTGDPLAKALSIASLDGAHSQESFSKIYAPYFKELAEAVQARLAEQVATLAQPAAKAAQR